MLDLSDEKTMILMLTLLTLHGDLEFLFQDDNIDLQNVVIDSKAIAVVIKDLYKIEDEAALFDALRKELSNELIAAAKRLKEAIALSNNPGYGTKILPLRRDVNV